MLISTAGNKFCDAQKRSFTLIEIVSAIVIMLLGAAVAVATLRKESPQVMLERASGEFELFCAKARFQASEYGEMRLIMFNPEERKFSVKIPEELVPEDEDGNKLEDAPAYLAAKRIFWIIPKEFRLISGTEDETFEEEYPELDEDGCFEMFRIFSDGSAAGENEFTLASGKLKQTFAISPLTGKLFRKPPDDEEEQK